MGVNLAVITLMCSCCINVIFLEHLIKASPDSGNLLLFLQFSSIAFEGFINSRKFMREKRLVPLKDYAVMVSLFFISSTTNNMALGYNVPMPLHMVFKSGSLVANLILGSYLLKRSYSYTKYLSVFMVSVGIMICTYFTSAQSRNEMSDASLESITVGVILLTVSLLVSARTGIYQESVSLKYGKHPQETLFYSHALPLPLFIFLMPSIFKNITIFNQSELTPMPFFTQFFSTVINPLLSIEIDLRIPILWQYVGINILMQYFCIRSVFYLISECSSLTVTLLLTLRKFISLVISVLYFKNEFTVYHAFGATFVFAGTLMYSELIKLSKPKPTTARGKGYINGVKNGHKVEKPYACAQRQTGEIATSRGKAQFKDFNTKAES